MLTENKAQELFFTVQPEDLLTWRPDRKGSKARGIEFAEEHGFKISGDIQIWTDGYVHAELRMDLPEGYSFNRRTFVEFYLDVKDQATAWASLLTSMTEIIKNGKN